MTRMFRTAVPMTLLLALVTMVAGCSGISRHKAERTVTLSTAHLEGAPLQVDSRNGSITVIADPSLDEVVVEATLKCTGKTLAEAQERVKLATLSVTRDTARVLHVGPVFPDVPKGKSGDGASIEIRLPGATDATLVTGNGRIEASGLAGQMTARSSNGRITIESHAGPVEARTSNGKIIIKHAQGEVLAYTSNGSVIIEDIAGPATIDTSNGSVTVHLLDGQYGPVMADSSNGSIALSVASGFAGRIELDTSNSKCRVIDEAGRVTHSALKKSGGHVIVGEGGEQSSLDTSNGKVTLTIRG